MILPEFHRATHYHPLRGGRFRFELLRDVSIRIPALGCHTASISFRDFRNVEWARIDGDILTARAGYAWNGASPCRWIGIGKLGFWLGTPTPHECVLATLFHDICFQFLRTHYWPIPICQCNGLFHDIMVAAGFKFASTYHGAVEDFGELFAGKYPKRGEFSQLTHLSTSNFTTPELRALRP